MEVVNTVGRRKAAVARVYVKPGKGQITINRKALEVYFPLEILQYQVKQPLLATNTAENYDIVINLDGGGITGQASAARLGIARALCEIDRSARCTPQVPVQQALIRTTGISATHGDGSQTTWILIYILGIFHF